MCPCLNTLLLHSASEEGERDFMTANVAWMDNYLLYILQKNKQWPYDHCQCPL